MLRIRLNTAHSKVLFAVSLLSLVVLGGILAGFGPGEISLSPLRPGGAQANTAADGKADATQASMAPEGDMARQRVVEASGYYCAPVGSRLTFSLDARTEAVMRDKDQKQVARVSIDLRGRMRLEIRARRPGELIAEVAFPDISVEPRVEQGTVDRAGAEALAQGLGRASLIRIDEEGRILGYRFQAGTDVECRNMLRTLTALMQFVIPSERGKEWTTEESDCVGRLEAAYHWQKPGTLAKHKLAYVAIEGGQEQEPPLVDARATAVFSQEIGWIKAVSWHEKVEAGQMGMPFTCVQHLQADLRLVDWKVENAQPIDASLWEDDWFSVEGQKEYQALVKDQEKASYEQELEGVSLMDLVTELQRLLSQGNENTDAFSEACDKLAWLFRLRPQAFADLESLLAGSDLDPDLASTILSAVGIAETPKAQDFLGGLFGDPRQPESRRIMAVLSLSQLEQPQPAVLQSIREVLDRQNPSAAIEESGLLILGALTRPRAGDVAGARAFAWLLDREDEAAVKGQLPAWLEALGNAGRPETLARVRSYLDHSSPILRASAVSALRQVQSEEVTRVLLPKMLGDPEMVVRLRAAEALAQKRSPQVLEGLGKVLRSEPDVEVRRAAVLGLGQGLGRRRTASRVVRDLLREAASRDPDADLRRLAAQLLQRSSGG